MGYDDDDDLDYLNYLDDDNDFEGVDYFGDSIVTRIMLVNLGKYKMCDVVTAEEIKEALTVEGLLEMSDKEIEAYINAFTADDDWEDAEFVIIENNPVRTGLLAKIFKGANSAKIHKFDCESPGLTKRLIRYWSALDTCLKYANKPRDSFDNSILCACKDLAKINKQVEEGLTNEKVLEDLQTKYEESFKVILTSLALTIQPILQTVYELAVVGNGDVGALPSTAV